MCVVELRQSEVEDFHRPARGQHDVARLEIAVHHAFLMRRVERRDDLSGDGQRVGHVQPTRDPVGQRLALDQFEDQGAHARTLFNAVDCRNVGVIERCQRPGFSFEAGQSIGIAGERVGQHLDGDVASEARVAGAVDLSHATRAEDREELVVAQTGAGQRHIDGVGGL